jgi:hypothetical protein
MEAVRVVGFVMAWVLVMGALLDHGTGPRRGYRAGTALVPDDFLAAGQQLESPGGRHVLSMERDGNLVLRTDGYIVWATGTATPGSILVAQPDGDVMLQAPSGAVLWSTGTGGTGPAVLEVHDDGVLRLHDDLYITRWATAPSAAVAAEGAGPRLVRPRPPRAAAS